MSERDHENEGRRGKVDSSSTRGVWMHVPESATDWYKVFPRYGECGSEGRVERARTVRAEFKGRIKGVVASEGDLGTMREV